jgi:hypothetical protein
MGRFKAVTVRCRYFDYVGAGASLKLEVQKLLMPESKLMKN